MTVLVYSAPVPVSFGIVTFGALLNVPLTVTDL